MWKCFRPSYTSTITADNTGIHVIQFTTQDIAFTQNWWIGWRILEQCQRISIRLNSFTLFQCFWHDNHFTSFTTLSLVVLLLNCISLVFVNVCSVIWNGFSDGKTLPEWTWSVSLKKKHQEKKIDANLVRMLQKYRAKRNNWVLTMCLTREENATPSYKSVNRFSFEFKYKKSLLSLTQQMQPTGWAWWRHHMLEINESIWKCDNNFIILWSQTNFKLHESHLIVKQWLNVSLRSYPSFTRSSLCQRNDTQLHGLFSKENIIDIQMKILNRKLYFIAWFLPRNGAFPALKRYKLNDMENRPVLAYI